MPITAAGAQFSRIPVFPYGYEEISVGAAPVGLFQAIQADQGLVEVHIQAENGPGRGTVDGVTVPAPGGPGFPIYDIDSFFLSPSEALKFNAIRDGATNLLLHVTYYRKI